MFPGKGQGYSVILVMVICKDWFSGLKKPSDDILGLRSFVVTVEILKLFFFWGGEGFGLSWGNIQGHGLA